VILLFYSRRRKQFEYFAIRYLALQQAAEHCKRMENLEFSKIWLPIDRRKISALDLGSWDSKSALTSLVLLLGVQMESRSWQKKI